MIDTDADSNMHIWNVWKQYPFVFLYLIHWYTTDLRPANAGDNPKLQARGKNFRGAKAFPLHAICQVYVALQ